MNIFGQAFTLLVEIQTWVRGAIVGYLDAFASNHDWRALLTVLPLGIFFGSIHALTPGHGKTVLSSYLAGSGLSPLRGGGVAVVLSLTHVTSAVLLALTAAPLITRTLGGVGRTPALENVSQLLLVLIGLWLVFRALRHQPHAHGEGIMVGFVTGLVPCPLTFLTMFLAMARGVPEAGLTFALAMMLGIMSTLAVVAVSTILARDTILRFLAAHGASMEKVTRGLDGAVGTFLILLALRTVV